jgi:hypothetical protein
MNHDDLAFGAPEGLTTEEAAELANVLPPTLDDAYAEGRKDEREAHALLRLAAEQILNAGHMNTEDLALLRAGLEAA